MAGTSSHSGKDSWGGFGGLNLQVLRIRKGSQIGGNQVLIIIDGFMQGKGGRWIWTNQGVLIHVLTCVNQWFKWSGEGSLEVDAIG